MGAIASQITSLTIVNLVVYSDADQRKHQSSVSLAFVRGIHRGPVNSPHTWPVTRKNVSIWWRHHETEGVYVVGKLCLKSITGAAVISCISGQMKIPLSKIKILLIVTQWRQTRG